MRVQISCDHDWLFVREVTKAGEDTVGVVGSPDLWGKLFFKMPTIIRGSLHQCAVCNETREVYGETKE